MPHRDDSFAQSHFFALGAAPVFRKWNKRPNKLIIVGDAWHAIQNVLRFAALSRIFRRTADQPVCQNAFEASFIVVKPLLRIGSK
jgi:hypothetical protein